MKKRSLLILLLFITFSSFGQSALKSISIHAGEKQKIKGSFFYVKNEVNKPIYILVKDRLNFSIQEYSESLTLVSSIDFTLPSVYKDRGVKRRQIINNSIHLFSNHFNKSKNTTYYYTESFSLDTRKSNQDEELVSGIRDWEFGYGNNYSPDGTKLVKHNKQDDILDVVVFDENFSLMNSQHRFKLDHYDFSFIGGYQDDMDAMRNAVMVDDNGGIYFLRRVYNKKDIKTRTVKALVNRSPKVVIDKEKQFYSYILSSRSRK